MKPMEVVLRQRPFNYVVQVGKSKVYDVTIPSNPPAIELVIENLTDRQGIYGDELQPLIFRLTESDIEILLNLSLLAGAFLYSYDDYLLSELDSVSLDEMDSLSSYNNISLSQNILSVGSTNTITPSSTNIELATQMAVMLRKYISASSSVMHLNTTLGVTDVSIVSPTENHMALVDSIVQRLVNQIFIVLTERGIHWFDGLLSDYDDWTLGEMENYSPKMSLVQSSGDVYMRFTLSPGDFDMSLTSQISDFISDITAEPEQHNMSLISSEVGVYQEALIRLGLKVADYDDLALGEMDDEWLQELDGYLSHSLIENTLGIIVESFPETGSFDLSFSNHITQNALLTPYLSANNDVHVQTTMNDGIELIYGLEFYDDDLLMSWDSWTLEDMAEAARIA